MVGIIGPVPVTISKFGSVIVKIVPWCEMSDVAKMMVDCEKEDEER